MKPLQTVLFAAFSALALGTSCHKCAEKEPSPCPTYDATVVPVAGLDAVLPCYKEASAAGQFKNHVVNTTADYNALFSCPPPAIDFTKYTLLIGKTVTNSGNSLAGQQVRQDCLNITYSVAIQQNPTTVVQPRVYYALVAKLPAGAQVTFDVQVKQ